MSSVPRAARPLRSCPGTVGRQCCWRAGPSGAVTNDERSPVTAEASGGPTKSVSGHDLMYRYFWNVCLLGKCRKEGHHEHRENPQSVPIWACRHKQVGASDVRFPLRGRGQKGAWGGRGHAAAHAAVRPAQDPGCNDRWWPSIFCGHPRTHRTNTHLTAMTRETLKRYFSGLTTILKNGMPLRIELQRKKSFLSISDDNVNISLSCARVKTHHLLETNPRSCHSKSDERAARGSGLQ